MVKRGDIRWAELCGPSGGEPVRKPVLVVQNDVGNEFSPLVIVACITSTLIGRDYAVNVRLPGKTMPQPAEVRLNQLLTVAGKRLGDKIASLPADTMARVDEALRVSLGLPRGG